VGHGGRSEVLCMTEHTLSRGRYARLRDGRVIRAEFLPGDTWPGWYQIVDANTFGGTCYEGSDGWCVSTQAGTVSNIVEITDNLDDAYHHPKAIVVVVDKGKQA